MYESNFKKMCTRIQMSEAGTHPYGSEFGGGEGVPQTLLSGAAGASGSPSMQDQALRWRQEIKEVRKAKLMIICEKEGKSPKSISKSLT